MKKFTRKVAYLLADVKHAIAWMKANASRYGVDSARVVGEQDSFVSAEAVRALAAKLREAGVPVVHVEYPQTEHAFDIILPRLSPAAQAALYETERFLALLATEPVTAAASPSNGAVRRDSLELQLGQEDFVRG